MSQLRPKPLQVLAYGYLPLVLFASLAHYLQLGLTEAGEVLPVAIATFQLDLQTSLHFVADPAVTAFLQGSALIAGAGLSMALTQKIAVQPLKKLIPRHLAIAGGIVLFWPLIV